MKFEDDLLRTRGERYGTRGPDQDRGAGASDRIGFLNPRIERLDSGGGNSATDHGMKPQPEALRRKQKFGDEASESAEVRAGDEMAGAEARRREIVRNAGPHFGVDEAADKLGWRASDVRDAANERRLYAVRGEQKNLLFPVWQIQDGRVIEGLEATLEELPRYDWVSDMLFFESEHVLLNGETPVQALLEGDEEQVIQCARQAWRHGAA